MSKLLLDTRYCNCYVALINLYILCENVLRVNRKNKCVREVMKLKMYYCIQIKLGISSRIVNHCQIHILGVKWVTSLYIWRFYLAYLMMWMASASFFHNDDSDYHGSHQCHSSKRQGHVDRSTATNIVIFNISYWITLKLKKVNLSFRCYQIKI